MTGPRRVTLLTQENCHLCDRAKEVIGRVARDHPVTVEEISLTSEAGRTLAARAGVLFAPGVLLDGAPFGFGRLSERKLRKALTRSGGRAVDGGAGGPTGHRSSS